MIIDTKKLKKAVRQYYENEKTIGMDIICERDLAEIESVEKMAAASKLYKALEDLGD